MSIAYSVNRHTGDGSTTTFAIDFVLDYLRKSHVFCFVDGEIDGAGDPVPRTLTWITDFLVDIGTAPAFDVGITIRRITPKTALMHDFADGAVLHELNIDESNLQNIMLNHEVLDGFGLESAEVAVASAAAAAASATEAAGYRDTAETYSISSTASAVAAALSETAAAGSVAEIKALYDVIGTYNDSLTDAIAAIGATKTILVIDKQITLTTNDTVPNNITLQFTRSGIFTAGSSRTLTIEGDVIAGLWQIFDGANILVIGLKESTPEMWGATGLGIIDDSLALQYAFNSGSKVITQFSAIYLANNNALTVPAGTFVKHNGTIKRTAASSLVTPVVTLIGSYTKWRGGIITTEKAHASGIVVLGHEDTAATYNALYWKFQNVNLNGIQAAGNIGISIVSSQPFVGAGAANYFGTVSGNTIKGSDIGIQVTEICNGHTFIGNSFWNMITSGYQFIGAAENSIFGGFLHTSTDGVIGIELLDERAAYAHNSNANFVYGYHVEPGGASSKSIYVAAGCTGNTLHINGNVAGGFTLLNANNTFHTPYTDLIFNDSRTITGKELRLSGDLDIQGVVSTYDTQEYISNGSIGENVTHDLFSVALSDRRSAVVELELVYYNNTLNKQETIIKTWDIARNGAITTATLVTGASTGTGLSADAFTTAVPAVFSVTTFNNGTATTGFYSYTVRIKGVNAAPLITVIN